MEASASQTTIHQVADGYWSWQYSSALNLYTSWTQYEVLYWMCTFMFFSGDSPWSIFSFSLDTENIPTSEAHLTSPSVSRPSTTRPANAGWPSDTSQPEMRFLGEFFLEETRRDRLVEVHQRLFFSLTFLSNGVEDVYAHAIQEPQKKHQTWFFFLMWAICFLIRTINHHTASVHFYSFTWKTLTVGNMLLPEKKKKLHPSSILQSPDTLSH